MKQCNICNFDCKNNVGSYIGSNAKVLFLFETPTYQADLENRITAGPVMELFKQYLINAGISFDDIAITYMVHCFSGTPNKDHEFKLTNNPVKKTYYENCRHYLNDVLKEVNPKLVVCVGDRPTKYFLGDTKAKLFNVYGAIVKSPLYNVDTFCIMDIYTLYMKTQYRCYGTKSFEFIKNFIDGIQPTMLPTNCTIVTDKGTLNHMLDRLLKSPKTAVDIETSGLNFLEDKIVGIGFALNKEESFYIPLYKYDEKLIPYWDQSTEDEIKSDLHKFFTNETLKIAYNGQFDFKFIRKYLGLKRINNASFDVMLASHLLNENLNGMRTLKLLSILFTDMGGYESILYNWLRENKITKDNMYQAPVDILGKYCCLDTLATYRLYSKFDIQLEREGLLQLFNTLTMPLQKVLMDVEYDGVQVDIVHLQSLESTNKKMLENQLSIIRGKIGDPNFNVNSTQQLGDLLFNKLGCKVLRTTATGVPATDKATIEKYAKKHSVLQDILDYKKKRTETSTFLTGMKALLDKNNKVHTSYLLHGTDSGRLSSTNPNLQNIPRDKNVKNLYIPEPGKVMIQCDLSQGEFNAWASYAQDEKMLNDIRNGLDIHRTVASKVWKLKPEEVSKELRTFAKRVVFGLMYGISIEGAAKLVGCTETEAQRIQTTFFSMYPKAAAWLKNIPVVARAKGYLTTVFGRKRRLSHLFGHPLSGMRNYAARVSSNFPMQSTVADICARALINLKPYLDSVNAQIVLTVHDSIIVQCPKDIVKDVAKNIMDIFTQPIEGYHGIIRADIEIGKAWGDLSKTKFDEDLDDFTDFPDCYVENTYEQGI